MGATGVTATGLKPKEARLRAGLSLIAAAVGAGASETTVRLYEAHRQAVSQRKREALDAFYSRLGAPGGGA